MTKRRAPALMLALTLLVLLPAGCGGRVRPNDLAGHWTLEGDTLTLTEDGEAGRVRVNCFTAARGGLAVRAEGSDNFPCVTEAEGEHFTPEK